MGKLKAFTKDDVAHIARLARLKVDSRESSYFAKQFNQTLKVVEKLGDLKTQGVAETSQVTGLSNVFRKDRVDERRILSQNEALSNTKRSYRGFFVVKAIFNDR